jgi:16S rRNA G966 N2-methylase RsmD
MNNKTLKKIFPEPPNNNFYGLKCDLEGLWSITHPKEAEYISKKIIEIMKTSNLNILDMTAGCGGNMISFLKYFNNVTGIEINKERYEMLKNNLTKYNYNNYSLINDDCINYINNNNNYNYNYDVYFLDPPWGGPDYKKFDNIHLYLSDKQLEDVINILPKNKLIILKIPFNAVLNINININIIHEYNYNNVKILFINKN